MDAERLRGKSRFYIFEQLERDRILIRMHLLGKQYERLTVVTGIQNQKTPPVFFIDCPKGFKEVVAGDNDCNLRFEFTGKDNLKYIFRTSGKKIFNNEICLKFPNVIERIQRRRNFRVAPPLGTKIYINAKPFIREMTVIDVSQGGALGAQVNQSRAMDEDRLFKVGNRVRDMELIFPAEAETILIQVKEAAIRRLGKNPATGRATCAFQFMEMERTPKKILMELIYQFQRDLLRNRLTD